MQYPGVCATTPGITRQAISKLQAFLPTEAGSTFLEWPILQIGPTSITPAMCMPPFVTALDPLPICVRDSVFPGFIDLRLMRQSGDPYSREDLVTAIAYTEALQFIYQSLMNFVLKENKSFVFTFGDKKWIEKFAYHRRQRRLPQSRSLNI